MSTALPILLLMLLEVGGAQTWTEGLKDIPRAAGVCRADDPQALPAVTTIPSVELDRACAVSPIQAHKLINEQGALVIDVRGAREFATTHIGGAWNTGAMQLRARTHLAKQTVLLFGDGKGEAQLHADCTRLRQMGFSAMHVIAGGLPAWIAAGQPIEGTPPLLTELTRLSATELHAELELGTARVLVHPSAASFQRLVPSSTLLRSASPSAIAAAMTKRGDFMLTVIVAARDALNADQIRQIATGQPVLFYVDGDAAYRAAMVTQQKVQAAYERGPPQPPCNTM